MRVNKSTICGIISLVLILHAGEFLCSQTPTIFDFPPSSFNIVGGEHYQYDESTSYHTLTQLYQYEKIALWKNNPIDIRHDFTIKFWVKFSDRILDNSIIGADGIVFVLQREGINSIGDDGGALGYLWWHENYQDNAIIPSFAIEFDTHFNDELSYHFCDKKMSDNPITEMDHIAFVKDANVTHPLRPDGQLDDPDYTNYLIKANPMDDNLMDDNLSIEDNISHCITIIWNSTSKTIFVYFDDELRASKTFNSYNDLMTDISESTSELSPYEVYWGITSATGDLNNLQVMRFQSFAQDRLVSANIGCDKVPSDKICGTNEYPICKGESAILYLKNYINNNADITSVEWTYLDENNQNQEIILYPPPGTNYPYSINVAPERTTLYHLKVNFNNGTYAEDQFKIRITEFDVNIKKDGFYVDYDDVYWVCPGYRTIETENHFNDLGTFTHTISSLAYYWFTWNYNTGLWEVVVGGMNPSQGFTFENDFEEKRIKIEAIVEYLDEYGEAHICSDFDEITVKQAKINAQISATRAPDCHFQVYFKNLEINTIPSGLPMKYLWQGPSYNGNVGSDDNDFLHGSADKILHDPIVLTEGEYIGKIMFDGVYYDKIGGCDFQDQVTTPTIILDGDFSGDFCEKIPPNYSYLKSKVFGEIPITYSWTSNPPNLILPEDINASDPRIIGEGTFYLTITDKFNCTKLIEKHIISKDFSCQAKILQPLCNSEPAQLDVDVFNGVEGYQYHWSPENNFNGNDWQLKNPLTNIPGNYTVTVTDADNCVCTSNIELIQSDEFYLKICPNQEVCIGETVTLQTITNLTNGKFFWVPTNGLDNPYSQSPNARPDVYTEYTVTVYNDNGCSTSAKCTVDVNQPQEDFVKSYCQIVDPGFANMTDFAIQSILKTPQCGFLLGGVSLDPRCTGRGPTHNMWMKLSDNGTIEWTKVFSFTDGNYLSAVIDLCNRYTFCEQDGIIFDKVKNFDGFAATGITSLNDNFDIEVFVLDNLGNIVYQKYFDGGGRDYPHKILQTSNGNLLVIGTTKSFEPSTNKYDMLAIMLSKDLTNTIFSIAIDSPGDYEVFKDFVETDSGELILLGLLNLGGYNLVPYIIKLNNQGEKIWSYYYKDPNLINTENFTNGKIIKSSENDGYIIAGTLNHEVNDDKYHDVYLFKIDENGNVINNSSKLLSTEIAEEFNNITGLCALPNNKIALGINNFTLDVNNFEQNDKYNLVTINADLSGDILEQEQIMTSCLYNYASGHGPHGLTSDLISLNKDGLGFGISLDEECPSESECGDGHAKIIVGRNSQIFPDNICYFDAHYSKENISMEKNSATFNPISRTFNHPTPNLSIDNLGVNDYYECGPESICYCDGSKIQVDIRPNEEITEPNQCCYTIWFRLTSTYSNYCSINKVKIDGTLHDLVGLNITTWIQGGTICYTENELSELKTITLQYYNDNNFECSTDIDIPKCKCDCNNDYDVKWSKLDIELVPATTTPPDGQCCFDIFINNQNDCGFRDASLIISFPKNYTGNKFTFTSDERWTSNLDDVNQEFTLSRGDKQINGKSRVKIGSICVISSEGSQTIKIKISSCPKEWKFDLNCEKPDCCTDENFNVIITPGTINLENNQCCFLMDINRLPISGCSEITHAFISTIDGEYISDFEVPLPSIQIPFCIDLYEFVENTSIEVIIHFFDSDGNIICSKTHTLHSDCDCCENVIVTLDPIGQCCFNMTVNNMDCPIYGLKIMEPDHTPDGIPNPPILLEIANSVPIDLNQIFIFCTHDYETINISFYDENGNILCSKSETVGNCSASSYKTGEFELDDKEKEVDDNTQGQIIKVYCIPNPASEKTTIYYELSGDAFVNLDIYNYIGMKITNSILGNKPKGLNSFELNTSDIQDGFYFILMKVNEQIVTIPLILLK